MKMFMNKAKGTINNKQQQQQMMMTKWNMKSKWYNTKMILIIIIIIISRMMMIIIFLMQIFIHFQMDQIHHSSFFSTWIPSSLWWERDQITRTFLWSMIIENLMIIFIIRFFVVVRIQLQLLFKGCLFLKNWFNQIDKKKQ